MKLTTAERRRIWLAQQRAREATLARLQAAPAGPAVAEASSSVMSARLLKVAMIALLLGCGLLATQTVEFNPPATLVEALIPRL
jgi:hypothetical protein